MLFGCGSPVLLLALLLGIALVRGQRRDPQTIQRVRAITAPSVGRLVQQARYGGRGRRDGSTTWSDGGGWDSGGSDWGGSDGGSDSGGGCDSGGGSDSGGGCD
jgi:hypothetical protein